MHYPGRPRWCRPAPARCSPPQHEAFWAAARKADGDSKGTHALIDVLLLHRHLAAADVIAGITAALGVGSINPDVVAVQARKAAQQRTADPRVAVQDQTRR